MRFHSFIISVLIAVAMSPGSADAQPQRVRVVIGSHLPQAMDVATVYGATCQSVQYRLTVTPAQSAILSSSNGADVDLTATTVGARLLERDVLVKVGFNCPHDALNIFLTGVKLVDMAMPTGFRDVISVRANGTVGTSYPTGARIDELASPPIGVSTIKPRE
jgi:hypothetical protein